MGSLGAGEETSKDNRQGKEDSSRVTENKLWGEWNACGREEIDPGKSEEIDSSRGL